jgi:hypothetical protein
MVHQSLLSRITFGRLSLPDLGGGSDTLYVEYGGLILEEEPHELVQIDEPILNLNQEEDHVILVQEEDSLETVLEPAGDITND